MRVKYVGGGRRVIAATGQVVGAGETVDVGDDLGRSLVEQECWQAVKATKKAGK